jgi:hypothetical protein
MKLNALQNAQEHEGADISSNDVAMGSSVQSPWLRGVSIVSIRRREV